MTCQKFRALVDAKYDELEALQQQPFFWLLNGSLDHIRPTGISSCIKANVKGGIVKKSVLPFLSVTLCLRVRGHGQGCRTKTNGWINPVPCSLINNPAECSMAEIRIVLSVTVAR